MSAASRSIATADILERPGVQSVGARLISPDGGGRSVQPLRNRPRYEGEQSWSRAFKPGTHRSTLMPYFTLRGPSANLSFSGVHGAPGRSFLYLQLRIFGGHFLAFLQLLAVFQCVRLTAISSGQVR